PYTQLRETYTQLRDAVTAGQHRDRLGSVAETLRRYQEELQQRIQQRDERRQQELRAERARQEHDQRIREEAERREQQRRAEEERKREDEERRRQEAERRREALRAVATFTGAMLLLAAVIGGMAFAKEKGLLPERNNHANPPSSSVPTHTPASRYTPIPSRFPAPTHTRTPGSSAGGGYTFPPREPNLRDTAFAAVRPGHCLNVHNNGYDRWSKNSPVTVPCGWLTAYVRVTRVTKFDTCESGGGRTSWSHVNDDLTRTVLCLERQFRTGQCFLATAKDGSPNTASLMTIWDCNASKVPIEYDFIMRITSVGSGTVGNCGRDYAWDIHGGRGTICATVA
ncbi:YqkE family protein, partial [Streptomyces sp. OF3]|nr:YqkE family protein [Streptomyces alkaliterrae]